jgi:thioesterase domain-containing protein
MRPRDPVELLVERIWADLLGRPWVGVRESFAALGGDEDLRGSMLERVARAADVVRLPEAAVHAATIEALAVCLKRSSETLRRRARGYWARNVSAPPGTGRPSLFFLHGLRAGGLEWLETAERLGADQPVYGIAPHLASGEETPDTIEAIARDHVRLIRAIQPVGPYLLGGFCNGAVTAFEAASQLVRQDWPVLGVLLVAPMLPGTYRRGTMGLVTRFALPPMDRALALAHRLQIRTRVRRVVGLRGRGRRWTRGVHVQSRADLQRLPDCPMFMYYSAIVQRYAPPRLDVPAWIFWPRREPSRYRVPSAWRWRRAAPSARTVEIPGAHFSCFVEHGATAARELRRAIDALVEGAATETSGATQRLAVAK